MLKELAAIPPPVVDAMVNALVMIIGAAAAMIVATIIAARDTILKRLDSQDKMTRTLFKIAPPSDETKPEAKP
jgi:hypothetical protein